jgi:hypothetical protein
VGSLYQVTLSHTLQLVLWRGHRKMEASHPCEFTC